MLKLDAIINLLLIQKYFLIIFVSVLSNPKNVTDFIRTAFIDPMNVGGGGGGA